MTTLPVIPFPDDPERQARHERECQWVTENMTQREIDDLLIAAVDVWKERCMAKARDAECEGAAA